MLIGLVGCHLARSQEFNQTSLTPAGEVSKTNSISLEWTLGDLVSESAYTNQNMYTQGFNQPLLVVEKLDGKKLALQYPIETNTDLEIDVFPNPVTTYLSIKSNLLSSAVNYHLIDLNGKILSKGFLPEGSDISQLEMKDYPSSTYYLHFVGAEKQVFETYKIIKN